MRRLSLKLRLLICSVLMAAVFSGYTNEIDKDFGFGEIDNKQYVYDYADEYTDSEEKKLQKKCEKLKEELGLDIILVTTNDLGYNDPYASDSTIEYYESQYAESFYLNGGYGDGILYLLDLDYDGIYVTESGLAEVYIDDDDHEEILDAIWEDFVDYDYYDAANSFINEVDDMVSARLKDDDFVELKEAWEKGDYVFYDEFANDYYDEIAEAHEDHLFTPFKDWKLCLGIGAIIGAVVVLIAAYTSNTRSATSSKTYMKDGSFNILQKYDNFTHTTTHSYKVESSSGGSGGRSSSHRSSSGGRSRSFSGGGRRR